MNSRPVQAVQRHSGLRKGRREKEGRRGKERVWGGGNSEVGGL